MRTTGETPEKGTLAIDFGGSKRLQLHAERFSVLHTGRGGRRLDTVGFQQDLAFVFLPAAPPSPQPSGSSAAAAPLIFVIFLIFLLEERRENLLLCCFHP